MEEKEVVNKKNLKDTANCVIKVKLQILTGTLKNI